MDSSAQDGMLPTASALPGALKLKTCDPTTPNAVTSWPSMAGDPTASAVGASASHRSLSKNGATIAMLTGQPMMTMLWCMMIRQTSRLIDF